MTKTIVHLVVIIDKYILIVFSTELPCWEFRVFGSSGVVFGERKLYYSAHAAEKAGREWIVWGS